MKLIPHSLILLWREKNTFETLKVMVLKHTPLGEINLPSVATDAFIPRRHAKFTKNTKGTALRPCWRLRRVFLPYFFGQIVVATAMQVGSALFDEGKQW